MPVDVQAGAVPPLEDIERIETQIPLRVKLILKDGTERPEDAARLLTRILLTVQKLSKDSL